MKTPRQATQQRAAREAGSFVDHVFPAAAQNGAMKMSRPVRQLSVEVGRNALRYTRTPRPRASQPSHQYGLGRIWLTLHANVFLELDARHRPSSPQTAAKNCLVFQITHSMTRSSRAAPMRSKCAAASTAFWCSRPIAQGPGFLTKPASVRWQRADQTICRKQQKQPPCL